MKVPLIILSIFYKKLRALLPYLFSNFYVWNKTLYAAFLCEFTKKQVKKEVGYKNNEF